MKSLVAALTLAMLTAASAQAPQPKTVPLHDNATKAFVGTATFYRRTVYIRDAKGELTGSIVTAADGTKTMYDPHGNVIKHAQPNQ